MVKLIKFGYFNKKIFLPFGVAIAQILINIMNKTLPEEVKNQPFEMLGASLSQMSISLIPLFKKFRVDSSYLNRKNTKATFCFIFNIWNISWIEYSFIYSIKYILS